MKRTINLTEEDLRNMVAESFRRILKEERSSDIDNKIVDLISFLHNSQKSVREIHWNTKEYSEHMVTDEAIDDLVKWEDSLGETYMSDRDVVLKINDKKPSTNEDFKIIMQELFDLTSGVKEEISGNKDYDNICAVLDEITEVSNQLLYKTKLK